MPRPGLDSLVPVPLVVTVVLMLVALVFLKVRAARVSRHTRERSEAAGPRQPPALGLPSDPVEAMAAMKARPAGRHGAA